MQNRPSADSKRGRPQPSRRPAPGSARTIACSSSSQSTTVTGLRRSDHGFEYPTSRDGLSSRCRPAYGGFARVGGRGVRRRSADSRDINSGFQEGTCMRARLAVLIGLTILVAGAAAALACASGRNRAGGFRERTRQRQPTFTAATQQHAADGRAGNESRVCSSGTTACASASTSAAHGVPDGFSGSLDRRLLLQPTVQFLA